MGRAERRRIERNDRIEGRKGKIPLSRSELSKMRGEITHETSKYDVEVLMTCFALAEHRLYRFGYKRLLRSLQYIDNLMSAVLNDEATMDQYRRELEDEVNLVIKCD